MRFRPALLLFCVGLSAAAFAAEPEPLVKVGSYHLKTERYGAAAVADGNYVYIVGGTNRGGILGDIERFDITTHEVTLLTDQLTPRRYLGAVLAGGKIFIFGGQGYESFGGADAPKDGRPEPDVQIYDLATGALGKGAPMPTPRFAAATALVGGKVYVIGGSLLTRGSLAQTNLTEIYDLATNSWTTGAPMPSPRDSRAVVVGDFVMVPGGNQGTARNAKVEFYTPRENAWRTLPDLCEKVSAHSVAFLGNHFFLFGNYGSESHVVAYDLRARTSQLIKPGFKPARHTAAVAHQGLIYVAGGNVGAEGEAYDDLQVFALAAAK